MGDRKGTTLDDLDQSLTLDEERRARRHALLRREQLVGLLDDCIFETDAHLRLTSISDPSVRHLGYYPVELVGCLLDDIIRPVLHRPNATPEQKRQPFRDLIHRYENRDGKLGLVRVSTTPLYDPADGSFLGLLGKLADASESVLAWQTLKKVSQVLDAEFVPLTITGPDHGILFSNPRFREITGYGEGELRRLSRSNLVFLSPDDPTPDQIEDRLTRHGACRGQSFYRNRRSDLFEVEEIGFRFVAGPERTPMTLWLLFDEQARRMAVSIPAFGEQAGVEKTLGHASRILGMISVLAALVPGFPTAQAAPSLGTGTKLAAAATVDSNAGEILKNLPRRQREVLSLMMKGYSNKHIARQLGISEATVKSHVRAVCDRLGAENRTQAVVLATNLGVKVS
ncbi:LuxR C-terminal-related transcriptional regulator [Magnetospira sp. QH-2]|uniref:LuxR C-terminal-related transcriptional regulator n=1 Tax=Magnetospira sp. (strain QH-2) TaxID=1288970 RepID=UPI0003E80E96|nr:LuxR C-terminal-related transcriptional regulator [Magnetospira sp. QH-2]CCQ74695.1 putative transcription regulator, LuxR family [Magnetospira sp. QH-2]